MGIFNLRGRNPEVTAGGNIVAKGTGRLGAAAVNHGAAACQGCGCAIPASKRKANTCRKCVNRIARQYANIHEVS